MSDHEEILRKKLMYQSINRGCKETDLILGKFAIKYLDKMDYQKLQEFATILSLTDAEIYDYFTGKKDIPEQLNSDLMRLLLNFNTQA